MTILDEIGASIRQLAEGAGASVVGIGQRWGAGSGIVLGEGQVLTNAHNVRGDQNGLPRHRDTEVLQRDEATNSQVTVVVEHRRQVRQQPRQRLRRHRSRVAQLHVSTELPRSTASR